MDRRADITIRPNGSLWREQTFRDYIGALDRREPRVRVERLSATDPFCVAAEADSRKRRRV